MQKLKKMLMLISLSVLVASCGKDDWPWAKDPSIPEFPEIHQYGPVYQTTEDGRDIVTHWHGVNSKTGKEWNINNTEARKQIMLCANAASQQLVLEWEAKLERIAKKRCK